VIALEQAERQPREEHAIPVGSAETLAAEQDGGHERLR
jgi:hypothetical protein